MTATILAHQSLPVKTAYQVNRVALRFRRADDAPLPAWLPDFSLYTIHLPDESDQRITVQKRGRGPYVLDAYGICPCTHRRFAGRDGTCRHEEMVRAVVAYLCCPGCGRYEAPYTRLVMRTEWLSGQAFHFLTCLDCERVNGFDMGPQSQRKTWLGGWLTAYEVRLVDALMCAISGSDRPKGGTDACSA